MPICLIGLGSNLGDRAAALDGAVRRLRQHCEIQVEAQSRWHGTTPIGGPAGQAEYLNGALRLSTTLSAHRLLAVLLEIETKLGRRRSDRWAPRRIDLDLLLYDDAVIQSDVLTLPHPWMALRRFVLAPAVEVAPDIVHPTIGWTVTQLLAHLNSDTTYVAVTGPIGAGKTQLARGVLAQEPGRLIATPRDEGRLERFYRDPTGQALSTEIQFLRSRAELLGDHLGSDDLHRAEPIPALSISDFWFDQSLVYAEMWLSGEPLEEFRLRWQEARHGVARPKLLVLLDVPGHELVGQLARRDHSGERGLTAPWLERLRSGLVERAMRPNQGPVLRLDGTDPQWALSQLTAAIQAMR